MFRWIAHGIVAGTLSATAAYAQQPPPAAAPAAAARPRAASWAAECAT